MKKNHARQLILRNIHAMAWKNSYKEFNNETKFPAARKFSSPTSHNFSNGPSLRRLSFARFATGRKHKKFQACALRSRKKLSSTLGKFTSFLARQVWTWVVKRSTSLIDLDLQQCFACDVGYVFSNLFGVSNQPPSLESYFRFSSFYTSSNADLVGFIGLSKSRLVGKSTSLSCFVISSPGRFSHLQSHGKAPWGRGWSCSKR